jgi:hypothetical protein
VCLSVRACALADTNLVQVLLSLLIRLYTHPQIHWLRLRTRLKLHKSHSHAAYEILDYRSVAASGSRSWHCHWLLLLTIIDSTNSFILARRMEHSTIYSPMYPQQSQVYTGTPTSTYIKLEPSSTVDQNEVHATAFLHLKHVCS